MRKLQFWYDFASTYSYLSAMRVEALAAEKDVEVDWRPFLLGPIFQAQGWTTSPFSLYPVKGRYMVRDMERLAAQRGLAFRLSGDRFPQNSLKAARLALVGSDEGWVGDFTREVYLLEFRDGADISEDTTLLKALKAIGQDGESLLPRLQDPSIKDRLRAQTQRAGQLGIFGAPSLVTDDGELFWGDDRLEQALEWSGTDKEI